MSKNAFELRAELLVQAQEHLEKQYAANLAFLQDTMTQLIASGVKDFETVTAALPKYPTSAEILAKANEFYAFVNGNTK